jgi:hypothetical protein
VGHPVEAKVRAVNARQEAVSSRWKGTNKNAARSKSSAVPGKPLPVEVKVPLVATFSFRVAHRGFDGWRQTGGDRPAPRRGRHTIEGSQGYDFLGLREEWARSSQGKKS